MAIVKTSYPERVTIVLNPDGTLQGAHQEPLETVSEDGTVITARQLGAVPLDAATLAGILPDQSALAADVQRLTDALAAMTAERDQLAAQIGATISSGALSDRIKAECRRRIYDVATAETQMNMTAAMAAGLLDGNGQAAFLAALQWVAAMREASTALIDAEAAGYADDTHWPACPAEVVALAAAF